MAPIDNGEDQMQRVTADVSREATRATARLVTTSGRELARAMAKAAAAIRAQIDQQRNHGKVSINKLEELSNGRQRDLVTLEDKEVVRELERSLNRRGVSYAIERDTVDGQTQYILHIQGKDANIVADSLERASARVDARRDRQQGTPDEATEAAEPEASRAREDGPTWPGEEPEDDATRLVEHGAAPYQNDESKRGSYFVTVERADGSQETLWGVDLQRAVKESGAELGDVIDVENIGSVPVTLPDGTETHRNTWRVEVVQSAQVPEPAPVQAPEPGQAWAPQPDMSAGKSLKSEMMAKMEAAESKHLQARAAAQQTHDAPARGASATPDATPKKTEAAKPVSVREKVKLRAEAARSANPKPNLDAPARGGVKR